METLFLEFTIRAALLVAATAAILHLFCRKDAAAQHKVWSGVVFAMLLLPVWTVWGPKLTVRVLPRLAERVLVSASAAVPGASQEFASDFHPWTWRNAILGVYLLGALVLLARLVVGFLRVQRLISAATLREGQLTTAACAVPVTVGWLRPRVLLPEDWPTWSPAKLGAVLAHESEHVRRRDPFFQGMALLNRALFWFHPAAWWLERRISTLAEEACDDVVLSHGHSADDYSEYLMDMARAVTRSGARITTGVAMPGRSLSSRIARMVEGQPVTRISRNRAVLTALACATTCTALAAGSIGHIQPLASLRTEQSAGVASGKPAQATKFVLADLKIEGDVHDRDGVRNRILKEWKDRQYGDAKELAAQVTEVGIRADFQKRGYFKVLVHDPVSQPLGLADGRQRIVVVAAVTEGDQFRLGTLTIQNVVQDRPLSISPTDLRDQFHLRNGDLFNVTEIRAGLEGLQRLYEIRGNADMKAEPDTEVDTASHRIGLIIRITEGPQPVVEAIAFDGNRRIPSDELASRIFIRPGDRFSDEAIQHDLKALENLGVFDDVRLEVQDSSKRPDGRIVVFHLKERPVIRAIMYEGIRSVSASEIRTRFLQKRIGLDVETPLNMNRLNDAEKTLRELLAERGHPRAIVRPTVQIIPGTNTARLVVTVQEEPSGPTP